MTHLSHIKAVWLGYRNAYCLSLESLCKADFSLWGLQEVIFVFSIHVVDDAENKSAGKQND